MTHEEIMFSRTGYIFGTSRTQKHTLHWSQNQFFAMFIRFSGSANFYNFWGLLKTSYPNHKAVLEETKNISQQQKEQYDQHTKPLHPFSRRASDVHPTARKEKGKMDSRHNAKTSIEEIIYKRREITRLNRVDARKSRGNWSKQERGEDERFINHGQKLIAETVNRSRNDFRKSRASNQNQEFTPALYRNPLRVRSKEYNAENPRYSQNARIIQRLVISEAQVRSSGDQDMNVAQKSQSIDQEKAQ